MIRALLLALLLPSAALAGGGDAPEISRSTGKVGGVVVLWPRVVPADASLQPQAADVQARLQAIAAQASPLVDLRPAPERACPMKGCRSATLGAVLAHDEGGCVVVALVGPPGVAPVTLVPWAGEVELAAPTAPFRGQPESLLTIRDFATCADLGAALEARQAAIAEALRTAMATPEP
jgi:hypothetical protein